MKDPDLDRDDFTRALADHLPTGPVWPRDPDSTLMLLVDGLAGGADAAHQRAQVLLRRESDPAQAVEMLIDWEHAYGLPDECTMATSSTIERRLALLARIAATGGQSRAYYIAVAAALGFAITIEEFRPFRAGVSAAGDGVFDESWVFTWLIRSAETTITEFAAGRSSAGDPLRSWGNDRLECTMSRIQPAHTNLLFAYGDA